MIERVPPAALLLMLALAAGGCSRQEASWRDAAGSDSAVAYERYLADYPAGAHAEDARARLRVLREDEAWRLALRLDTPEAFQRYLSVHPDGRFADEARRRLGGFLARRAPRESQEVRGETGGPTAPAAAAGRRLQLGAFRAEASARRAWSDLEALHGDLLEGLAPRVDGIDSGGRLLWRLRAGPVSERRAREVCAALRAREVPCLVVSE